jgi:exopolysaccharide biosynthesis polyprenyl glycosylphosphotransferase
MAARSRLTLISSRTRASPERATAAAPAMARRYVRATPSARSTAWNDPLRRRMLAAADLLAAATAAVAGALVGGVDLSTLSASVSLLPLLVVSAKALGLYDTDHARLQHLTTDEAARIFHAVTTSVAVLALVCALMPRAAFSPAAAVTTWGALLGLVALLRTSARAGWRKLVPAERALLIGDGQLARDIGRKLELEQGNHLVIVEALSAARGIGGEQLACTLAEEEIDRVILATEELDESTLYEVLACCRNMHLKLSVIPPIQAMLGTAVSLTHLAELPVIEFRTWDPSRSTMLLKRAADLALGTVALVLLAPALLLLALAVRLDSRGPALYRQARAGKDGVPFRMWKFRTMVPDADALLGQLVAIDQLAEPVYKLRRDPRVTRVGRLLRRWSLDELPQFLNVVRGDMSLVGPRPEDVRLVAQYREPELFRLQMRPGMTGPMQVHGRGELNLRERLAVEREYIENYSLARDFHLILRTMGAVLRGQGAF